MLGTDNLKILLDSDGIISQIKTEDSNYFLAQKFSTKIKDDSALVYIAATTWAEVVTTLQRKYNNRKLAEGLNDWLKMSEVEVIPVDGELIALAFKVFLSSQSKQNTFFDAINIAVVKKYNFDAIFSFDSWYKKQGIKLAQDL